MTICKVNSRTPKQHRERRIELRKQKQEIWSEHGLTSTGRACDLLAQTKNPIIYAGSRGAQSQFWCTEHDGYRTMLNP